MFILPFAVLLASTIMFQVLYPAVRAYHGAEYADKCLAEHKAVKELLVKLDGMSASDDGFEKAVEEAVEVS